MPPVKTNKDRFVAEIRSLQNKVVRFGRGRRNVVARFQGANPRCVHAHALQHTGHSTLGHHARRRARSNQKVHERPHSYSS